MQRHSWVIALGLILAGSSFALAQADDGFEPRFQIGDSVERNFESAHPYDGGDVGGVIWQQVVSEPGATFLRVHLTENCALADGDVLIVRDRNGQVVREYTAADVADRWTPSVEGDIVTIELVVQPGSSAHGIEVDQVLVGTYPLFPDQATAGGDIMSICNTSVPARIRTADPVVRLTWIDQCGGSFLCSGWLFSPQGHMMTNAHCANSQFEANNLECWFNYVPTACDLPPPIGNPDVYDDAITFVQMDCNKDFAVHKVFDPVKGNPADRYGFLRINPIIPANGTQIWVPQHPGGIRKQISENCTITDNTESGFNGCADPPNGCGNQGVPAPVADLAFDCGIMGGSSGSPVLNLNDQVVAIAHAGTDVENFGVRMFNIMPLIPNFPLSVEVTGPATVNEEESIQIEADADYLNGSSHSVNAIVDWTIIPPEAGTITQGGLFTANNVNVNTPVTIGVTLDQQDVVVHGTLMITVINVGVDTPILDVQLVPSVDPNHLLPGQTFDVDLVVNTDGDPVNNVRLLQFDTSLSTGVTINSINWGVNPLFNSGTGTLYLFFPIGDVYSAIYSAPSPVPGFVLNLGATQTTVARLNVTFQSDGELNVFGTATPPTTDESVRFLSGFESITEYSQAFFNVDGGSIELLAGTGTVSIVSSTPPNGAVDARQPSNINGSNPVGWNSVDLNFSGNLESPQISDFSIGQEGGAGSPPTITSLLPLGETSVRVSFSGRINPGAWTTLAHLPSGSSVTLGYLPADVNGDGTSSPVDILALIDFLNGVGPARPIHSTDMDRSGVANAADILRNIDLLNGADGFDVWNGVSLP